MTTGEPSFLIGGGAAAEAIAAFDWSTTALGPIAGWPLALKTALGMMLSSHFPKAIVWGPDLLTFHNDAFRPILGAKPGAIGRSFRDVWAEAWPDIEGMVRRTFAGEAIFIEDFALTIERNGYPEEAFFTFCYSPIRGDDGEIAGLMDTVIETTGTVEAQRQLAIVNGELAHRMGNVLTMVNAIVNLSLRHARDLDDARETLAQRLAALAQVQMLLTSAAVIDTGLSDLVEKALAPHAMLRHRITVTGDDCRLDAKQGLSLSLVLNELLTNSIKYGALSGSEGTVAIAWGHAAEGDLAVFRFSWEETAVGSGPSERQGFGTRLLKQFAPAAFQGNARMAVEDGRLVYEIVTAAARVSAG